MPVCVKLLTTLDGGVLFVNREIALLMKPIADLVLGSERGEVIQVTVPVTKQALKMVVHWLEMKVSNGELRWRLKDLPPEVLLKKEQYYQIAFTSSSTSSSSSSSLASSTSTSIVDEDPAFLRRLNDGTLFHLFTAATALQVGRLAELIITHHATSLLEYNKVDQIRQRFHLFEEVGDHFGFGSPEARANVEAEVLWAAPKGFFLPSPKPIVKTESDEIKKKEEEEKSMDTGESDIQIVWNINDLLPDAYLLQVFSEMTLHSRMALRAVCGRWNALIISQCASILSSNGGGLFIHLYDKKVEQEAAMCSQSEDDEDDKEKKVVETVMVVKIVKDEDDTKELKNSKNSKNFKILKNYKVSKTLQNFKYPKEKKKEEEENEEPDFYQQFLATSLPENCPDSCDGSGYSVNESRGADNRPKNLFYMDDIERECCSLPRRSPAFSIERLLEIDLSTVKQEAFQISGFSNCLRSCFESNRATLQPQQQQQLEEGANNNNNSVTIFCPKLPYLESMPKLDYLLAAIVHGLPSLTTFTLWLQKYWEMGNGPVELPFLLNALNGHRQLRELSMNASLSTAFQHEEDLWQKVDISPVVGRLEKANLGLPLLPLLRGTFFAKGGISSQLKSLKINCNYQRVFSRHRQDEREHLKGHLADNRITDLGLANFLAADDLWHVAKLFPHVQKLTLLIPVSLMV